MKYFTSPQIENVFEDSFNWVFYEQADNGQFYVVESPEIFTISPDGVITGKLPGMGAIKPTGYLQGDRTMLYIEVLPYSENEPNDSSDNADILSSYPLRFRLSGNYDVDWFKVDTKSGDTVKFLIKSVNDVYNNYAFKIEIYDSGFNIINISNFFLSPDNIDWEREIYAYPGGWYYIKVFYSSDHLPCYNGNMTIQALVNGEPIEDEVTEFTVDGISYSIIEGFDNCVEVCWKEGNNYSGDITVPSHVTNKSKSYEVVRIGSCAFDSMYKITSITLPDNIISFGESAFQDCRGITEIKLPESLKYIDYRAFWNCKKLKSLIIPDNVEMIGPNSFEKCIVLEDVYIGRSVKEISKYAFGECTALKSVTCYASFPPVAYDGSFSNNVYEGKLYVYEESFETYKTTFPWSQFNHFRFIGTDEINAISLNETHLDLEEGESFQLIATTYPYPDSDVNIIWSSSKYSVASVSENGYVRTKSPGEAIIKVMALNHPDIYAECLVNVYKIVYPTSVVVNPKELVINIGETYTLIASITPENTSDKSLEWSSSDFQVVSVNENGVLEANGVGDCVVRATSLMSPYIYGESKVTVIDPDAGVLSCDSSSLEIIKVGTQVIINNKPVDQMVYVFDAMGKLLFKTLDYKIDLLRPGFYIIRSGSFVRSLII